MVKEFKELIKDLERESFKEGGFMTGEEDELWRKKRFTEAVDKNKSKYSTTLKTLSGIE